MRHSGYHAGMYSVVTITIYINSAHVVQLASFYKIYIGVEWFLQEIREGKLDQHTIIWPKCKHNSNLLESLQKLLNSRHVHSHRV